MRAYFSILCAIFLASCSGSLENPQEIDYNEFQKLEAKGYPYLPNDSFNVELYNGTDYKIVYIDIEITNKKIGKTRKYRLDATKYDTIQKRHVASFVSPFENHGNFTVYIGDFLKDLNIENDFAWQIVSVYGFK